MAKIKTIGVLTSGGDAPGMNAAIRAVTRSAIYNGYTVKGIFRGYDGLINDEIKTFTTENVSGIIGTGGTILKTARSKEFMTDEGRQKAFETIQKEEIDALVVIGGNGSLTGAMNLARDFDICCIGLPGTIDNDLYGTDNTIGYDTTMNTIVECVDRIRDTAQSHERIFFVEVMGRDAGFLAQNSAIASGAEAAIIPEDSTDVDQLAQFMERGIRKSKKSCIVIVSESPKCGALYYADRVRKEFPEFDVRVSILGHLQRGGRPSARDRILASRTGCGAIEAIIQGQRNVMIGVRNNEVVYVPLSEAIRSDKPFDRKLIKVLDELSNFVKFQFIIVYYFIECVFFIFLTLINSCESKVCKSFFDHIGFFCSNDNGFNPCSFEHYKTLSVFCVKNFVFFSVLVVNQSAVCHYAVNIENGDFDFCRRFVKFIFFHTMQLRLLINCECELCLSGAFLRRKPQGS